MITTVSSILTLIGICTLLVQSQGICCGDDSSNAVLAKNLAWGHGYAHSVDYESAEFSMRRFDSTMTTTGPTLILPASAAIWWFGNQYWVPGATQILIWATLLLLLYRSLWQVAGAARASAALTVFLGTIYVLSSNGIELWYILVGEVPQALFVLLSCSIWAADPRSRNRLYTASLLMGLSVLTKNLSALYAAAYLSVIAWWSFRYDAARFRQTAARIAVAACLTALPIVCFEAWKLLTVGWTPYVDESARYFRYLKQQGVSVSDLPPMRRAVEHLKQLHAQYGVGLPRLLGLTAASVFITVRWGSPFARRLASLLFLGALCHVAYWLFLSIGWPRYLYAGVLVIGFLVSLPFLAVRSIKWGGLYLLALALYSVTSLKRVTFPEALWPPPGGSLVERQARVSRFLNANRQHRPFVGSWGGAVADMEYLSNGVLDFKTWRALSADDYARGFLLVANGRLDGYAPDREKFKEFTARCGAPLVDEPPYAVFRCTALQSGAP